MERFGEVQGTKESSSRAEYNFFSRPIETLGISNSMDEETLWSSLSASIQRWSFTKLRILRSAVYSVLHLKT